MLPVMQASESERVARRRLRTLRLLGITACAASFVLLVPAVETGSSRRGGVWMAALRVFFVPVGEVQDPALLWTARVLVLAGLVVLVLCEIVRRQRNGARLRTRRSGDPALRSGLR
jgi:hypothetical protein